MKNVLIDNWFLENIAFKYNDQLQLFSSQEFLNILEAMNKIKLFNDII